MRNCWLVNQTPLISQLQVLACFWITAIAKLQEIRRDNHACHPILLTLLVENQKKILTKNSILKCILPARFLCKFLSGRRRIPSFADAFIQHSQSNIYSSRKIFQSFVIRFMITVNVRSIQDQLKKQGAIWPIQQKRDQESDQPTNWNEFWKMAKIKKTFSFWKLYLHQIQFVSSSLASHSAKKRVFI